MTAQLSENRGPRPSDSGADRPPAPRAPAGPGAPEVPGHRPELETVLAAWHNATIRLERTHRSLQAEVKRLTDELEVKNRELARKNRLADLGQMASHVAHEVRNNLVPVTLYLSLLRRRISGDPRSLEVLDKIEAGFTALEVTIHDLLHFTSDREPSFQSCPLRPLIDDVLASLSPQMAAQKIAVLREVPRDHQATADRDMLRRAVLNLVLNAVDAMPDGGTLTVATHTGPDGVEIRVIDTGPGITDVVAHRAFEPFFTTKCGGTGLGLAIVQRVAEVHGGKVSAANRDAGGAVFTFRIPRSAQEVAA